MVGRYVLPFGPALAALIVAACSETKVSYIDVPDEPGQDGGAAFDAQPSADSGLGILSFRPSNSFSGFDGTHTFKVPVAIYDSGNDLALTATEPSAVEIVPKQLLTPMKDGITDNGKYFLVTVKRAGTITLTATSGGKSVQSTITVTPYPAGRYAVGELRYKTAGSDGDPPCTDCHVNGASIDHSPAALATATDEKVGIVITTGISTHGVAIQINGQPGHMWTVSDAERDGLVTYLRGLEPKGFK